MKSKILFSIILALFIFSACSSEKTIGLKENIHHDDFEYSVQNVSKTQFIGSVKAKSFFYIVTFRVENNAKRVGHDWDNSIAYLTDENGTEYEDSYEFQKRLRFRGTYPFNLLEKYRTQPGETDSTLLVFELPADAKEVYLKVRGEFLMGDLFDGSQFKKTRIKLF